MIFPPRAPNTTISEASDSALKTHSTFPLDLFFPQFANLSYSSGYKTILHNMSSAPKDSSSGGPARQTPLTCSGHTRPVVFLAFSELNPTDVADYYCISACKGRHTCRQTNERVGQLRMYVGRETLVERKRGRFRAESSLGRRF